MKKILILATLFISSFSFSQSIEPQLEVSGNLVKATYFYENGSIQQVGYFKNGKLDGKWNLYNENGIILTIAEYSNGEKTGVWKYFNDSIAVKEVTYSKNSIISENDIKSNFVAGK